MKFWKKLFVTLLAIIIILSLVVTIFAYKGSKDDSPEVSESNTNIYSALAGAGLKDIIVNINNEKAIIAYNLENKELAIEYVFLTIGAVYSTSPSVKQIIITQFEDLKPIKEYRIQMKDIEDFANSKLTEEELISKFSVENIN